MNSVSHMDAVIKVLGYILMDELHQRRPSSVPLETRPIQEQKQQTIGMVDARAGFKCHSKFQNVSLVWPFAK